MGISQEDGRMRGWLYLIRSNRFGLQTSRKRYFVLQDNSLNCYKFAPTSIIEDPIRSAMIDPCIRVMDNGRESIHRNAFFIFTIYNASNHRDQLKLGARSSEEAAMWIHSIAAAALKARPTRGEDAASCFKRNSKSLRLSHPKARIHAHSVDWTVFPSSCLAPVTADVIAPSTWTIFGCKNGLRLFREARDGDLGGKRWADHPAIMAVGVVDATSETIFQTLMSLGPSRSEWDFCFAQGRVVEHLDGHTDIIHKKLRGDWLPWGMRRRDMLLQRYWRREDDGTYVILYHSIFHPKCAPERGCIRACLKSGGYVISPVNQGKHSVVKHMLAVDWKFWKSYMFSSSAIHVTIRMLERVAALRELFTTKFGCYQGSDLSSGELTKEIGLPQSEREDIKVEVQTVSENTKSEELTEDSSESSVKPANMNGSILQLNEAAADEFFDVQNESEYGEPEAIWPSDAGLHSQDQRHPLLSPAAAIVKRIQDRAVHKKGYNDLEDASMGDNVTCCYGSTLLKDLSCTTACSWSSADPSSFLIRGDTYLRDHHKNKANGTLMQLVAADWLKSNKREDDLGGRPGSIVQDYGAKGGGEFFFIVNIQVPGSTTYNLAFYYMLERPLEDVPLLESFVRGDDAFRNSRFKLIPYISKGSWIVKQSVGKKACLVGQALQLNYFRGKNYLEVAIDVGSSTVARGVVSLVLSYLNNLVIELAFLIQANTQEELPETLLGTCRVNHLDVAKAVSVDQ